MEDSILKTIRVGLSLDEEDTDFDKELITHINSAFFTLHQIGVGDKPFVCTNEDQTWSDFLSDIEELETVKLYIIYKVRLLFDPPTSSYVLDEIRKQVEEMEWRLNAATDYKGGGEDV